MSKVKIGDYVRFYYSDDSWLILKLDYISVMAKCNQQSKKVNYYFKCIYNHSYNNIAKGEPVILTETNGNNWMDENFDYLATDDIIGYLL